MQYASSWGQVWTKKGWSGFREWYEEHQGEKIKGDRSVPQNIQYWPENSWKKYHIKYLIDTDRYFVFPRSSLTTMFTGQGTHMKVREHFLQVPLQLGSRVHTFRKLEDSTAVYDVFGEMEARVLKKLAPALEGYDLAVDLNAIKPASEIQEEYLLTTRSAKNPVLSFGREMKPHELNVIHNVPGHDIHLACTKDCTDVSYVRKLLKVHEKSELAYWYPIREYHFSRKRLITTSTKTDKRLSPGFLFKKALSVGNYAWNYFFGKK
jgi:hypothetical protein